MLRIVGLAAIAAIAWFAAPWIAMRRHGTLDQQVIRAWREEEKP